jgi:hypothetical protein
MIKFLTLLTACSILYGADYPDETKLSNELKPLLKFTVMGCGPYHPKVKKAMKQYVALDNKEQSSQFIAHLGDVCPGKDAKKMNEAADGGESVFVEMRSLLYGNNTIPSFFLIGDNETTDQIDSVRAFSFWQKHLLEPNEAFAFKINRQKNRPENFSFVVDDVLIIGIHKVGGKDRGEVYWKETRKDAEMWIAQQFQEYPNTKASVLLAHASPRDKDEYAAIFHLVEQYSQPVLYINANGHNWRYAATEGPKNFTRIQLDLIHSKSEEKKGPYYPPIQVIVTQDKETPFLFDRRLNKTEWIKAGELKF